jgi:glycosyltransferase involved in cell wall biosynthesis
MGSVPGTGGAQAVSGISRPLVIAPADLGSGGLGTAAAEFHQGLISLGLDPDYVGNQPNGHLARLSKGRPFRRAFGMAAHRRLTAREVRRAVPDSGWDLSYGIPGTVPIERGSGIRVIYQATRHPAVERAAVAQGARETGGRPDISRAEVKRREFEIENADLIHVTSRAVEAEMLAAGVAAERLVYSPHGVDLERFRPAEKNENLTVAFVGPLSLRKGVDVVADLATRLGDSAVVEAVGGPTCPWSRGVAEAARFTPGTSVPEMLSRAQFLVLPSRSDGFAFVVLEALASGAIPIVTPEVGAAEVVRLLDQRLVIERPQFAERAADLILTTDPSTLSGRARALAEGLDRRQTSRATAEAVLERVERLRTR